jgi:hypothetical protein
MTGQKLPGRTPPRDDRQPGRSWDQRKTGSTASPSAPMAAACLFEDTAHLWDAATGQEVLTLK